MKKLIYLTLVFALCFCLCACGENGNSVSTYESDNNSQVPSTTSQTTSLTMETEQNTDSYKLPAANEFIDGYKSLFTLSDIREENGKITFKTSTGEQVIGYINASGKVNKICVHSSGKDATTLLQEDYHYYPVCQYLSDVMDENVNVDAILAVINEAEPTTNATDLSATMTWNNKKDGVGYELKICQYPSMSYSTMDFTIEIY